MQEIDLAIRGVCTPAVFPHSNGVVQHEIPEQKFPIARAYSLAEDKV